MRRFLSLFSLLFFISSAYSCTSICFTSTKYLSSSYDFVSIESGNICSGTTCHWKIKASCNCYISNFASVFGDGRLKIHDGSSQYSSTLCSCDNEIGCACSGTSGDVAFVEFTSRDDSASFSLTATAYTQTYYNYVGWSVGATIGIVFGCIAVIVIIVVIVVLVRRRRTPYYPPPTGAPVPVPVVGYTSQPAQMAPIGYGPAPPTYIVAGP